MPLLLSLKNNLVIFKPFGMHEYSAFTSIEARIGTYTPFKMVKRCILSLYKLVNFQHVGEDGQLLLALEVKLLIPEMIHIPRGSLKLLCILRSTSNVGTAGCLILKKISGVEIVLLLISKKSSYLILL